MVLPIDALLVADTMIAAMMKFESVVGEKFDCASAVYLPDAADRKFIKDKTRLRTVKQFDFNSGYRRAPESDQKRQLSSHKSMLQNLDLTPEQWTKLNSRGVSGSSVKEILTPSQYTALKKAL